MQTANDRLEVLKWCAANLKKVRNFQKTLEKLSDQVMQQAIFQDIQIHSVLTHLQHLEDRMDYLDTQIDGEYFIKEGVLKLKGKKA